MDRINASTPRRHPEPDEPDATAHSAKAPGTAAKTRSSGPPSGDSGPQPSALATSPKAGYATALATLSDLTARYPEAGVAPQTLARAFAGKSGKPAAVRLEAAQRFVRAALANQPKLADRLLSDFHLKHLPAAAQRMILQANQGLEGSARYARGEAQARQLKAFDAEQLADVAGMVKAGTPLSEAIASERKELARQPAIRPARSVKSQAQQAMQDAKRLSASADKIGHSLRAALHKLPDMTRSAELQTAALAAATLPSRTIGAAVALTTRFSTQEFKGTARQAEQMVELGRGDITDLQRRTNAAYMKATNTLSRFRTAANEYHAALSASPPDTMRSGPARLRMQAEHQALLPQAQAFIELAKAQRADHAEFDDLLKHIVVEVAIMAVAKGLAGGARVPGVGHSKLAEVALEKTYEGMLSEGVHGLPSALEQPGKAPPH